MPSIITRICDGDHRGFILVLRERSINPNDEHLEIEAVDGKVFHDERKQRPPRQCLFKYGTIHPGYSAGLPKGNAFCGEEKVRAAIREFVEETGTLPPEDRLIPYMHKDGSLTNNVADAEYFLFNVTEAEARQIIHTFYVGDYHYKRMTFLIDGLESYVFQRVDGPAYREYESFLLQFVDLGNVKNDTLRGGSDIEGIGVPEDFRITNIPGGAGDEQLWNGPVFTGLNQYTRKVRDTILAHNDTFNCPPMNTILIPDPADVNANIIGLLNSSPKSVESYLATNHVLRNDFLATAPGLRDRIPNIRRPFFIKRFPVLNVAPVPVPDAGAPGGGVGAPVPVPVPGAVQNIYGKNPGLTNIRNSIKSKIRSMSQGTQEFQVAPLKRLLKQFKNLSRTNYPNTNANNALALYGAKRGGKRKTKKRMSHRRRNKVTRSHSKH